MRIAFPAHRQVGRAQAPEKRWNALVSLSHDR
jgi:hypothetical protein